MMSRSSFYISSYWLKGKEGFGNGLVWTKPWLKLLRRK